jgi:hypothetical protein
MRRSHVIGGLVSLGLAAIGCGDAGAGARPDASAVARDAAPAADGGSGHFSFFVTSLAAMQRLSGSQSGFGGDLRFGETGLGAGLRGADKICRTIAESSAPGSSQKTWRAFLSATAGEDGAQVDAIDRIGDGPWYDRLGRLIANDRQDLMSQRPTSADSAIVDDLPNEDGVPNHAPDPAMGQVDNHDTLTGTNNQGQLYSATATCQDWTSSSGAPGMRPRVGHSWVRRGGMGGPPPFAADGGMPPFGMFPGAGGNMGMRVRGPRGAGGGAAPGSPGMGGGPPPGFPGFPGDGGDNPFGMGGPMGVDGWMSSLDEAGCGAGVSIVEMGPPDTRNPTVGSGGGYGGIYCFALTP